MENMSIFDIIGPNMIGPSSSHTAGALKIALIANKVVGEKIKKVKFVLYGSFAKTYKGHGTDKALLGGIMGFSTDNRRIKDSFELARKSGIEYEFETSDEDSCLHPNTVDIIATDINDKVTKIRGVSIGGGNAIIEKINGADIVLSGEYNTIFVTQIDKPGVIANIAQCLSDNDINIAFMRVFRESKGKHAYTIIESDDPIPKDVIKQIEQFENIESAILIQL